MKFSLNNPWFCHLPSSKRHMPPKARDMGSHSKVILHRVRDMDNRLSQRLTLLEEVMISRGLERMEDHLRFPSLIPNKA
jgi:hypothetical protein